MSASDTDRPQSAAPARIPLEAAREFIIRVLVKKSVFQFDAQTVADRRLDADLRGLPQHGLRRLPDDVAIMDLGDIDPRGRVLTEHETAAVATLDGSRALGPVAATKAIELAMQKARAVGIGAVAVHHSQSLGSAGSYVIHAARQGLIAIATSNYGNACIAAPGTTQATVTDSEWAWGIPTAGPHPMVIETQSAVMSRAELEMLTALGFPLPTGAALDATGAATTEATAAKVLLPQAGGLGFGLALAGSLLAGGLAGGKPSILKTRSPASECGEHLLLAIDIAHFTDRDRFLERTQAALQAMSSLTPVDAQAPWLPPGEAGFRRKAELREHGIPVEAQDLSRLQELARKLKLEPPAVGTGI